MIGLNRPPCARPPAICSADNVYIHHAFYGSALSTREKSCTRSRGAQVRFTKVDSVWVTKRPLVVCIADNVREAKFGTNMHFSQFALTLYPGKLLAKHSYYERSISQRKRGLFTVKATIEQPSSSASQDLQESKVKVFPSVIGLPGSLWRQILRPLSNFGFGNRSVWEGGVGIFVISGAILLSLTIGWVKGYQIRNRTQKYHAVIEFSKACGIRVGTPVRIRGVDVGNVINVKPSLESIDVSIQILDSKVVIPRNSVVEVNQSGLLMDTLIDITPPNQLPEPTVSPLDPRCSEEGMIVCDRQRLKGEQGVNLDDLVGLFTRLAREVDEIGISEIYSLADRVSKTVEDAKPLLSKVTMLVEDLEPLLKDVQGGGLLKDLEALMKGLNEAGADLKTLNESLLTPDNRVLLQQSVLTLTKTLKNIESISGDVSGITGDAAVRHNLKHLVESLSRLLAS